MKRAELVDKMFHGQGDVPAHIVPNTSRFIEAKVKGKPSGKKVKTMPMTRLDDLDMINQSDIDIEPRGISRDDPNDKGILKL